MVYKIRRLIVINNQPSFIRSYNMANFICPFSKKVCNPSCEYWEFEEKSTTKKLMGFIPIQFNIQELVLNQMVLSRMPTLLNLFLMEYKKYVESAISKFSTVDNNSANRIKNSF